MRVDFNRLFAGMRRSGLGCFRTNFATGFVEEKKAVACAITGYFNAKPQSSIRRTPSKAKYALAIFAYPLRLCVKIRLRIRFFDCSWLLWTD
jgi:hypothetical protein